MGLIEPPPFAAEDLVWLTRPARNPQCHEYPHDTPFQVVLGDTTYDHVPWFTRLACRVQSLWFGGQLHAERHRYCSLVLDLEAVAQGQHFIEDLEIDPERKTARCLPRDGYYYPNHSLRPRTAPTQESA